MTKFYTRINMKVLILLVSIFIVQSIVAEEMNEYKDKVPTKVNEMTGLKAGMKLLERPDASGIDGVRIKLANINKDKDLELQVFDEISLSVMISVLNENGERLSNKPKKYTTEGRPLLKKLSLPAGEEMSWNFYMKNLIPNGLAIDINRVNILADIYMDVAVRNKNAPVGKFVPIEFHLRDMNVKVGVVK